VGNLEPGSNVAIGTEINMVARLDKQYPEVNVECLEPTICPCSTMYMIHPAYLMDVLERLVEGEIPNQVIVETKIQAGAKLALERMLSIRQ
jgi:quinolinate synthase